MWLRHKNININVVETKIMKEMWLRHKNINKNVVETQK